MKWPINAYIVTFLNEIPSRFKLPWSDHRRTFCNHLGGQQQVLHGRMSIVALVTSPIVRYMFSHFEFGGLLPRVNHSFISHHHPVPCMRKRLAYFRCSCHGPFVFQVTRLVCCDNMMNVVCKGIASTVATTGMNLHSMCEIPR